MLQPLLIDHISNRSGEHFLSHLRERRGGTGLGSRANYLATQLKTQNDFLSKPRMNKISGTAAKNDSVVWYKRDKEHIKLTLLEFVKSH